MGKKINPRVFRLGMSENWRSRWYASKDYAELLQQDIKIRKFLAKELREASIDRIDIERSRGEIIINISAAKPGVIIGRGGSSVEDIKNKVRRGFLEKNTKLQINITEVSVPNLSASVIVQNIGEDLEKRMPFRRVMKMSIEKVMKAGAKGVKIMVAGRLNGAEIARSEKLAQGKIPLQTIRSNIDYSRGVAQTIYGVIGIKVWIYKGEYFDKKAKEKEAVQAPQKTVKLFSKANTVSLESLVKQNNAQAPVKKSIGKVKK
jgi:small subunit ribosomal protein S3